MNEKFWINVLSGADRSAGGSLLRAALTIAEPAYAVATSLRNQAFNSGLLKVHTLPCPVMSVGNITTGGTGKTPTVSWLVKQSQLLGKKPGILSRGYRSLDGAGNDEKRLLDEACPGVPHVQSRDRVAAGRTLLLNEPCDVLILDDGFQHRRLKRDLDLVLIDALNPWGYGHLLPRGLLRESMSGLSRAGVVLITRSDLVSRETCQQIESGLHRLTDRPILRTRFVPDRLINSLQETCTWQEIRGRRVGAFCGIGNPEGFWQTLLSLGVPLEPVQQRRFPDHHHYSDRDLQELAEWAARNRFDLLLTTRKDLVKIPRATLGECPLWGVDIVLDFVDPDDETVVKNLVMSLLGKTGHMSS